MAKDAPGKRLLDKYELVTKVGAGGMATVWRAITHGASGFQRTVAVKRILPRLRTEPGIREMFVEEARVDARIRHPNVVQIHDFGLDKNDEPFLVTEWVEGVHLEQYVRSFTQSGELPPYDLIAAIGVEVLRALDAAHRHRDDDGKESPILHRDVTPQNILLDQEGFVKLTDFGMARAMDRKRATHPDIIKGKISYLAPEMTRGIGPNARTDIYGLGVVLWESLTGERLFDAPTDAEVFKMLLDPHVPLLTKKRPDHPLSLAKIVHRALEPDPATRYASAAEMLSALTDDLRTLASPVRATILADSIAGARKRLQLKAGKAVDAHGR
jgi:serine/threonine-protein kinase